MSKMKFELNRAGVAELLKSEAMKTIINSHASAITNRAGDGYEQDSYIAGTRVVATVAAVTKKAKKDNLENNTLLKAVK
jgi:hypothetical protein